MIDSTDEKILSALIDNRFTYARTADEKADVVRQVIDVEHPDWASLLYLWDRPCRSMRSHDIEDDEFPHHQLRVYTSPESGWGAINFVNEESAWDSYNPNPPVDIPTVWFDPGHGLEFHSTTAIPLDIVRAAVVEFTTTGRRPTCTAWQPARLF